MQQNNTYTMSVEKIAKIEDLFVLEDDQKIIDQKIKRLTAPGENYGSLMLSVDVKVQGPRGVEEIRTAVKMIPPNDFIQEMFNTQVTFRKEIAFYKTIFPLLQNFQKEHGIEKLIDFFPKCHGSRLNLNNEDSAKVDSDAALVLENLKAQNFVNVERTIGFDLDEAKLVFDALARLHAVPLALKLQKSELFDNKIRPFLSSWHTKKEGVEHKEKNVFKVNVFKVTDTIDELIPYKDRIKACFDKMSGKPPPQEPFATICHNDCWVNNVLVKLENGKAVKSVLVDFQGCDYGSPAKDVVFFMFTSVKSEVVKQHYDLLIKFYHDTFIDILKELSCDITPFSFDEFLKEIAFDAANFRCGHIIFMLLPIFASKENVRDITELTRENLGTGRPTDACKKKLVFVIEEFAKRNWI